MMMMTKYNMVCRSSNKGANGISNYFEENEVDYNLSSK